MRYFSDDLFASRNRSCQPGGRRGRRNFFERDGFVFVPASSMPSCRFSDCTASSSDTACFSSISSVRHEMLSGCSR